MRHKLTPDEAADFLGLTRPSTDAAARQRFWSAVHTNSVPHFAIGRRTIVFDERELRVWLETRRRGQRVELQAEEAA